MPQSTALKSENGEIIKNHSQIVIFASGRGSNANEIIHRTLLHEGLPGRIENSRVSAVISDNPEAPVLKIANNYGIGIQALAYKRPKNIGPFQLGKHNQVRREYSKFLAEQALQFSPDIIVFAGFLFVVSEEFLDAFYNREDRKVVPVINLHPALLHPFGDNSVEVNGVSIPVLKGNDAIKQAYYQQLPFTGVTVHLVLPRIGFDVGPKLGQEVIAIDPRWSLEELEERVHTVEHELLPAIINRFATGDLVAKDILDEFYGPY